MASEILPEWYFIFYGLPGVYRMQRQIVWSHFFQLKGLFNQIKYFFIIPQKKIPRLAMNHTLLVL